ncbi:MAG: hypothetical protein WBE26_02180 [Phycisphaerae bacterium]
MQLSNVSKRIGSAVACCLVASIVVLGVTGPATAATPAEIEQAIVDGLDYLDSQQNTINGSWENSVGVTGLAVLKFEHRAYELGFTDPTDPGYQYHQQVIDGLAYIVGQSHDVDISSEPAADGDGDNIGTYFGYGGVYDAGIAMMALATSQNPGYTNLLQDAVDWMSFAQNNSTCGVHRGGWGYSANDCWSSDNSNGGYATLGLGFAAASGGPYIFGLTIPAFVRSELSMWVNALQDPQGPPGDPNDGGSHYDPGGGWVNILKTGNLLYEMHLAGDTVTAQRVQDAIDYIERHWGAPGGGDIGWVNHCQAMFTMMKGFEAFNIDLIDADGGGVPNDDWFDEVSTHLVNTQNTMTGAWPNDPWGGPVLSTAWALLTLEKSVPSGAIPTVTEWGLVVMTLMLLVGAKVYFSRRRAMQA